MTITRLKRTSLYSRTEGLGIKPTKQGRNSFIIEDELHQLQALHEHLGRGGMIGDFGVVGNDSDHGTLPTNEFSRYGFTFTHAAKQGREWLWRVMKE